MKIKDIRTYDDYISLKNNSTYAFLMVSELIDNSISSFDNHYGEDNWGEVLKIEVDFYFDKSKKKDINGTKAEINSYINVVDNAFGMNDKELVNAVRLNKKNQSSISTKNRHGRGLKQCAFYFGADLEIETWNAKDEINTILLSTSIHDPQDEVELETFTSKSSNLEHLESRGTSVKIKKIYTNKSFAQKTYVKLIESISYRYIKLIKSGMLEITYSKDVENMYSNTDFIRESNEHISKVNENFKYDENKTKQIIKMAKEQIEEFKLIGKTDKKKKFGIENINKYESIVDAAVKNIEKLLTKSVKDNDLDFTWTQNIDINGKELKVKFWKLEKNYSKHRGYRVYEGDRALLHPPMADDEGGTTTYHKAVFPSSSDSGSSENRFAGEFDILDINATTSTDKSKFIFESNDDEEVLNAKLALVWRVYNTFEMLGRSDTTNSEGKEIKEKDWQQIRLVARSKFANHVEELDVIEDELTNEKYLNYMMPMGEGEKWGVNIRIDKTANPSKIWDRVIDKNDGINYLNITTYSGHKIWKRMDNSNEFKSETLIPISMFIAHFEISNILDGTYGSDVNKINFDDIESPFDKLNNSGTIIDE